MTKIIFTAELNSTRFIDEIIIVYNSMSFDYYYLNEIPQDMILNFFQKQWGLSKIYIIKNESIFFTTPKIKMCFIPNIS